MPLIQMFRNKMIALGALTFKSTPFKTKLAGTQKALRMNSMSLWRILLLTKSLKIQRKSFCQISCRKKNKTKRLTKLRRLMVQMCTYKSWKTKSIQFITSESHSYMTRPWISKTKFIQGTLIHNSLKCFRSQFLRIMVMG